MWIQNKLYYLHLFLHHLVCLVHDVLAGLEVEAGLLVAVVDVWPGLQVRDVQRVTQRLDVRAQDEVVGAKQRLDPVAHLVADLHRTRIQTLKLW